MKKYLVYGKVLGSKYLGTYSAESAQDAVDKAIHDNGMVNLCHQCSKECEDPQIEDCYADEEDYI